MTLGQTIRRAAVASPKGMTRTQSGGWSIVMTGGPNDVLGKLTSPQIWRLSGKRLDGRRPSAQNLDYLRRVAVEAGALDVPGEEMMQGTWHWSWNEIDGRSVSVRACEPVEQAGEDLPSPGETRTAPPGLGIRDGRGYGPYGMGYTEQNQVIGPQGQILPAAYDFQRNARGDFLPPGSPLVRIGAIPSEVAGPSWWQWLLAPIPTYLMSSDEAGKRKTADEVPAWVWMVSGGILAGAGILGYKKVTQR